MRWMRMMMLAAALAAVAGCGLKGDLVQPDRSPKEPAPEQPAKAQDEISKGGDAG